MKTIELKGTIREDTGKKYSKQLRMEEKVPCVMYGGKENIHFSMPELSFKNIVYTPNVYLLKIEIEGDFHDAVIREVQFHPVTDKIIHADFKEYYPDQPVIINLPVKIIGESIGLKAGGKLRIRRRVLKAKGLVKYFPEHLELDITDLDIGHTIRIEDLKIEGLEFLDSPGAMIVSVVSARVISKAMLTAIEDIEAKEAEAKEAIAEHAEEEKAGEDKEAVEGEEKEEEKPEEKGHKESESK
ncbi:MAG: 50S ribosomal protein L25 [Bacteroidales bacterium]|nr:50S ribosomal protein L25 [Bacteroidales bacterium]